MLSCVSVYYSMRLAVALQWFRVLFVLGGLVLCLAVAMDRVPIFYKAYLEQSRVIEVRLSLSLSLLI